MDFLLSGVWKATLGFAQVNGHMLLDRASYLNQERWKFQGANKTEDKE